MKKPNDGKTDTAYELPVDKAGGGSQAQGAGKSGTGFGASGQNPSSDHVPGGHPLTKTKD